MSFKTYDKKKSKIKCKNIENNNKNNKAQKNKSQLHINRYISGKCFSGYENRKKYTAQKRIQEKETCFFPLHLWPGIVSLIHWTRSDCLNRKFSFT